ncbi:MAG: hypothetical protein AAGC57_12180 [Pseudomonadota bacterium]
MRRTLLRLFILFVLLGPILFLMLVTQTRPLVETEALATPRSAADTRTLVHQVRAVTNTAVDDPTLVIPVQHLNGAITFGARLIPGLRGEADVVPEGLRFRVSVPVPKMPQLGWLNVEAVVPPFQSGPRLASVSVGHIRLPPGLSLWLGTWIADLVLGDGLGTTVREAVPRFEVGTDTVTAVLKMEAEQRSAITRRMAGLLRGGDMPTATEIQGYYLALREAIDAGALPDQGSFLPYLTFALERALAQAAPGRVDHEYTAAIFAVTQVCGARDFRLVVGRLVEGVVPRDERSWARDCKQVTFAGRIDSKRHFITAAAIKAASTMKVSFTIGEFKELVDTISGAGGFDFTDIVANASGIRFAETMMAAPREAWPALIDRLGAESDVLASYDGIPSLMPKPEFDAKFGDVDDPRYHAMVDRIERRIDGLPLHVPLGPGG